MASRFFPSERDFWFPGLLIVLSLSIANLKYLKKIKQSTVIVFHVILIVVVVVLGVGVVEVVVVVVAVIIMVYIMRSLTKVS